MQHSPKPIALAVALALGSLANANAQENAQTLPDVDVIDFRGEQMDSIKYTRPLQETPRIITVLPQDLLEEQNVTSLNEALRNIPGISLQAGEGNPPGGDQLKIRGFNARDDINVNGMRDIGNYFRDPFFIEQLEVVKGPNSAFSGRGSAGGTINFVTKKPLSVDFNRAEVSVGTDSFFRTTLDMNRVLDDDEALRITRAERCDPLALFRDSRRGHHLPDRSVMVASSPSRGRRRTQRCCQKQACRRLSESGFHHHSAAIAPMRPVFLALMRSSISSRKARTRP